MIEFTFWFSLFSIVYCYFLYPLALGMLGGIRTRKIRKKDFQPSVSIIIAAYNEENCIGENLRNKLRLLYDRRKLEVIVVSDGSTDRTDRIAASFEGSGVRLLRQEPRQGKTAALNKAVAAAGGEIVCFADANSLWDRNALELLLRSFADPEIGYVTGKMIYVNDNGNMVGNGCGAYMRYENKLRELETITGSIVGVDGGIDAMRKSLYKPMQPDALPDFILPLSIIEQGYRVVFEPHAILREKTLDRTTDEFRMRVRVALRSLHAIWSKKRILNPLRFGLFSWQLTSHKLLRYFIWLSMLALLITNCLLKDLSKAYAAMLAAQLLFYAAAAVAVIVQNRNGKLGGIFSLPYYFTVVNWASAVAFLKFVQRKKITIWQPRKG